MTIQQMVPLEVEAQFLILVQVFLILMEDLLEEIRLTEQVELLKFNLQAI